MQTVTIEPSVSNPSKRRVIMPQGIIGFGEIQHYTLAPLGASGESGLFWELQSVEDTAVSFVLMALKQSYFEGISISDLDLSQSIKHLGINVTDTEVYLIISIEMDTAGNRTVTANVRAPFVFHTLTNRGWQVVLTDAKYPMAQII